MNQLTLTWESNPASYRLVYCTERTRDDVAQEFPSYDVTEESPVSLTGWKESPWWPGLFYPRADR